MLFRSQCDTFNTANCKGIPYLDVTTVYSKETNSVFINVVNRHKDKAITADILSSTGEFEAKALLTIINSESLKESFTYENQSKYIPVTKEVKTDKSKLTFTFPAHSYVQIKVGIKR